MKSKIKTISFFYRPDNPSAFEWERKIKTWLSNHFPSIIVSNKDPEAVVVLGGDGTILEAARTLYKKNTIIFGLESWSSWFFSFNSRAGAIFEWSATVFTR